MTDWLAPAQQQKCKVAISCASMISTQTVPEDLNIMHYFWSLQPSCCWFLINCYHALRE